jgi:RNA polymerase sigma-B factor
MSMSTAPGHSTVSAPLGPPPSTHAPGEHIGYVTEASLPALFERWQQHGDRAARELLVERFMPLARSLARRYMRSSEPFDDLLQVASLGLIKAIDRFDPSRGFRFPAFAVPTILGELRRHFRDTSWAVHVSRGAQERAMEVEEAGEELTSRQGRPPTVNEIAEYLELDVEQVLSAMQVTQAHSAVSLDAPRPGGGGEDDLDSQADHLGVEDERFALVEECAAVTDALKCLSPRERHILHLRFASAMTQSEIAAEVGVSQMQVSRLLRRSLERLRELADGDLAPCA